jgi:hypothetical protein
VVLPHPVAAVHAPVRQPLSAGPHDRSARSRATGADERGLSG